MLNWKKLLNITPKTVGDAFKSIKQKFNVVSADLAHLPGQRLYKDANGHWVEIKSSNWGVTIKKIIAYGTDKNGYKKLVGTPAELSTIRTRLVADDGKSIIKRCFKTISNIIPLKKSFDPLGIKAIPFSENWHPKRDHITNRIIPNVKMKKLSDKTKILPNTKSISGNLKI